MNKVLVQELLLRLQRFSELCTGAKASGAGLNDTVVRAGKAMLNSPARRIIFYRMKGGIALMFYVRTHDQYACIFRWL